MGLNSLGINNRQEVLQNYGTWKKGHRSQHKTKAVPPLPSVGVDREWRTMWRGQLAGHTVPWCNFATLAAGWHQVTAPLLYQPVCLIFHPQALCTSSLFHSKPPGLRHLYHSLLVPWLCCTGLVHYCWPSRTDSPCTPSSLPSLLKHTHLPRTVPWDLQVRAWVTHWSVASVSPLTTLKILWEDPHSDIHFLRADTTFSRSGVLDLASLQGFSVVDSGLKLLLIWHSWHSFAGRDQVGINNLKEKAPLPKDIVISFQEWKTFAWQ